ncbi:MAG: hypothetical protein ISP90_16725 [Nevskia sp.]|nr:hypothetical protein [Nevskia sp.]
MIRFAWFAYGVACYGLFLAVFLYFIGFVAGLPLPKTVDSGPAAPLATALAVDLGLIALFGLQHSVMARAGFKRRLAQWLPPAAERSTYVLATNLVLILLFAFWQPLPGRVWEAGSPLLAGAVYALAALGWLLVLVSTFLTDHFDLFGLRQVYLQLVRRSYTPVAFREILFYRWIRHPMMLGLLIALWASPVMTASHLLFSLGMTVYIFVGIRFEEAGLRAELGQPYRDYAGRTGRLLPFF